LEFRVWDNLTLDRQRFMKQDRTFWPFSKDSVNV
jgi:hypothetical protein